MAGGASAGRAPRVSVTAPRPGSGTSGNTGRLPALHLSGRDLLNWPFLMLTALVIAGDSVLLGPLLGSGSLQLLDYGDFPPGPNPHPPLSAFGLPPGITSRAPVDVASYWVFAHIHWSALHLVPLAAVAPLACVGFARIFTGRTVAAGAATLLYTVNPFIFERM